jgi:omega-amidase
MNELNISMIQTALFWENPAENLKMFDEKIHSITEPADIILLPEMFTTGFSMNPKGIAETWDGRALQYMKEWAKKKNAAICGSLMFEDEGKYYNRLIWMSSDGKFHHYDKRHLFGLGVEDKTYTPGDFQLLIEYRGWKIKPLVCYDLRFPVWCRNTEGYDLLLFVANWPERRILAWKSLLVARAIENQCYVAGVNRVGDDGNGIYHSGDSMVIDPKGEILEHVNFGERIIHHKISLAHVQQVRKDLMFNLSSVRGFRCFM